MSDESYKDRQDRVKAFYAEHAAGAAREKGLVVVFTGNGKGKTTAALGMLLRTLTHGMRAGVVQFLKTSAPAAEAEAFKVYGDRVDWHRMGEGFTWDTQDRDLDRRAARRAWEKALEFMARPELALVLLDEINVAVALDQLPLDEVLVALGRRRTSLHVVLTGRGAKPELIEAADLVTEMRLVKHPFSAGVAAQKGIEY
jgi:cob(I)alamin adenosyltransferase